MTDERERETDKRVEDDLPVVRVNEPTEWLVYQDESGRTIRLPMSGYKVGLLS